MQGPKCCRKNKIQLVQISPVVCLDQTANLTLADYINPQKINPNNVKIKPVERDDLQSGQIRQFERDNFAPFKCGICGLTVYSAFQEQHKTECSKNFEEVQCRFCNENIIRMFMNDHYAECDKKLFHDIQNERMAAEGHNVSKIVQSELQCDICLCDLI